jgi:hypothetical protein
MEKNEINNEGHTKSTAFYNSHYMSGVSGNTG